MKTFLRPNVERGFSLIELMVAMGISVVLMAALSSIFATSVKTREKIDLEGQKIETARYSLDTLAEDIRLAGYYGTLSLSSGDTVVDAAIATDWKYVGICSTASVNPLTGWSVVTPDLIQVPIPIFGYEAHDNPLGALPAFPICLVNSSHPYKTGTDFFVIRRASTCVAGVGDCAPYDKGNPYLQTSSCGNAAVDKVPFIAADGNVAPSPVDRDVGDAPSPLAAGAFRTGTDYFDLHGLACTPTLAGAHSSLRRLITRVYFISTCNDCATDSVPTLKVAQFGKTGWTFSTIAPGVENMHLEYGLDLTDTAGTSDGSIEAWTVSNDAPRTDTATGTTPVASMRMDGIENRWEDVMAVKLFLVTRDMKTTAGIDAAKSFVMGSKTLLVADDDYRRRMTSTSVKLVNMAGRREQP